MLFKQWLHIILWPSTTKWKRQMRKRPRDMERMLIVGEKHCSTCITDTGRRMRLSLNATRYHSEINRNAMFNRYCLCDFFSIQRRDERTNQLYNFSSNMMMMMMASTPIKFFIWWWWNITLHILYICNMHVVLLSQPINVQKNVVY